MKLPSARQGIVFAIAMGLVFGLIGAGFLGAFIVRDYDRFPFNLANRLGHKAREIIHSNFAPPRPAPMRRYVRPDSDIQIDSIFTPISAKIVSLPMPKRQGHGGAATSWGEHVVVLTHEGSIYLVDENLAVTPSAIALPDNHFDVYLSAARQPPWDKLNHRFDRVRYNDILYFQSEGEQGLLVSYTKFDTDDTCYRNTVSKLTLAPGISAATEVNASSSDWQELFSSKPCLPLQEQLRAIQGHMAGGRMLFDNDQTLYLASGDYSWDGLYGPRSRPGTDPAVTPALARDPEADYGKVIAINIHSGEARHVSRGHRNIQGITRDRAGRIWVVEHGVRGGDELNLIYEGGDYGWPDESYGTLYTRLPIPDTESFGRHEIYEKPRIAWLPSIATSGLTRVEGFHEAWDGDLLVSTLAGKRLARVRLDDDRVVFTEFIEVGRRIRHVHQRQDGRIVLWTNDYQLFFLSPSPGGLGMQYIEERITEMDLDEALLAEVRAAVHSCIECHSLEEGSNTTAPSLAKLVGSPLGSTGFGAYSDGFVGDGRIWTRELLAGYLKDPEAIVPGTTMPNPNIADDAVIEKITDILSGLTSDVD
jgi:aldose sugar dehydrogenase